METKRLMLLFTLCIGAIVLIGIGVSVIVAALYFAFGVPVIYSLPVTVILALYASYDEGSTSWYILKYPFSHR